MIDKHSLALTGASGTKYLVIFSALTDQDENEGAVYVVSICSAEDEGDGEFDYKHSPIFLGQTADLASEFVDHPKARCFELAAEAMKADRDQIAVGSIVENDAQRRTEIEEDLSGLYTWVCNRWNG